MEFSLFIDYTPLHFAAKSGHYDTAEVLYRAGADPLRSNEVSSYCFILFSFLYFISLILFFHFTPLDFAQRYQFDDIVALLKTPRTKLQSIASSRGAETPKSGMSVRDTDRSRRSGSSYEKSINELLSINE